MHMTQKPVLILAMLALLAGGCRTGAKSKAEPLIPAKKAFKLPEIPSLIWADSLQKAYLVENFWTNFDFADRTRAVTGEETEQLFSGFASLVTQVPSGPARTGIRKMMHGAGTDSLMVACFMDLCETYFYDPNSQLRNELLFAEALEAALASYKVDQTVTTRYRYLLNMCRKNLPGNRAADFSYTTASGKKSRMQAIRSPYLLLYFNNPGCHACETVKNTLAASSVITRLLQSGILKILSVYPDEDLTEWQAAAPDLPATWINACDKDGMIRKGELYDLKAIPTLYLLDGEKNVLLKDAPSDEVIRFLTKLAPVKPANSAAIQ